MSLDMRGRILIDDSQANTALDSVAKASKEAAEKMQANFHSAANFIKGTIGLIGITSMVEKSIEAASTLEKAQAVQAVLLTNANRGKEYGVKLTQDEFLAARASGDYRAKLESETLTRQATYLSIQTGINRQQLTQAQTLALTNSDIAKLVSSGPKVAGALGAVGGPLNGIHQNFQLFLTDAANLSATMGGGHGGSVASSARMLTRMLSDPAKRMSAMTRYGFTLSQTEQMRIKTLETTTGLYAAQEALLSSINTHIKGAASVSQSPIDLLKNDIQIIYTTLGQGLLPFFSALAGTLSSTLTSFLPTLQTIGEAFGGVLQQGGVALGKILVALQPVINLFAYSLLPAIIAVFQPLMQLVLAVIQPLGKAFQKIIGSGAIGSMNTLSGIFATMANEVGKSLLVGVNAVAKAFNEMSKNGQLDAFMQSILKVFQTLMPILPDLAGAFSNLLVAVLPLFVAAGPALITILQVWADLLVKLTPAIVILVNALAQLVGWISGNKGLTQAIALLAAAWFTKGLFLTPIKALFEGIGGVIRRIGTLGSAVKSVGGMMGALGSGKGNGFVNRYKTAGEILGPDARMVDKLRGASDLKGRHTLGMRLSEQMSARAEKIALGREARITNYKQKLENGIRPAHAEKMLKKLEKSSWMERAAKRFVPELETVAKKGGKFKFLKNIIGFGGALAMSVPKVATNQLDATNNLVAALVNLTNAIQNSGFGSSSGGKNDPIHKLENKIEDKIKGKVEDKVKKKLLTRVGSKIGNVASKLGKFGRFGSMAAEGGEALAATGEAGAAIAGGEAALEGSIMAAGAASGAATLGIGLAVAGATVAYMKWHKQINHFVGSSAKHLWNGTKSVAKWGVRTAANVGKHILDANKAVLHFGLNVAKWGAKTAVNIGKHVLDADKAVLKFGVGIGKHAFHAAGALAKGAAHLGAGIVHGIDGFFGGLFGGGGKKPKDGHPMASMGQLKGMTFTGGALNVHVVSANGMMGKQAKVINVMQKGKMGSQAKVIDAMRGSKISPKAKVINAMQKGMTFTGGALNVHIVSAKGKISPQAKVMDAIQKGKVMGKMAPKAKVMSPKSKVIDLMQKGKMSPKAKVIGPKSKVMDAIQKGKVSPKSKMMAPQSKVINAIQKVVAAIQKSKVMAPQSKVASKAKVMGKQSNAMAAKSKVINAMRGGKMGPQSKVINAVQKTKVMAPKSNAMAAMQKSKMAPKSNAMAAMQKSKMGPQSKVMGGNAMAAMRGGKMGPLGHHGGGAEIHPGAVVIHVHGSMDHATMKQVKAHVNHQFLELQRSLKAVGR